MTAAEGALDVGGRWKRRKGTVQRWNLFPWKSWRLGANRTFLGGEATIEPLVRRLILVLSGMPNR